LKSGAERNMFFKKIYEEWNGVYRIFIGENFLRNIDEDVLNHEVKMNREDNNEGNYWDYWTIYSIKSMTIEIHFPFSKNNATHVAQVMKGPIEQYIEDKLVSSEEWKENHGQIEDEDEINDKYSQPREEDGNNKRKKAVSRNKQRKYVEDFILNHHHLSTHNSGCICIDNKDEYCLKYAIACGEHFHECHINHQKRHQHYIKYLDEHNYNIMNFPVGSNDLEKFHRDNPKTIMKIYGAKGVSKHTTKKELHQRCFLSIFQL
jgi:hypothetical protein